MMVKQIIKSVLHALPSKFFPIFVSVVVFSSITKNISVSSYGNLSLLLTIMGLIATIFSSWIQNAIMRFLPKITGAGEYKNFLSWLFWDNVPVTLILVFVIFLTYYLSGRFTFYIIVLGFLISALNYIYFLFTSIWSANLKFKYCAYIEILKGSVYILLIFTFLYLQKLKLETILISMFLSTLIAVALFTKNFFPGLNKNKYTGDYFLVFFKFGFPMTISSVGSWIIQLSDRWFLDHFFDSSVVGKYSANYNFYELGIRDNNFNYISYRNIFI